MSADKTLALFVAGFVRAAALTFAILVCGYWDHYWLAILSIGAVGGYMTVKYQEVEEARKALEEK